MSALDNFNLRDVSDNDHEWLVELHNDPAVLRNITNPSPITLKSHLKWFKHLSKNQLRKIFCVNDSRVGFCKFYSVDNHNHNCVLGADIHKDYRGHGYAKHMWRLMLEHCFEELQLYRVSLTVAEYNVRAIHIYTKMGFIEEGRLIKSLLRDGTYYDQVCMYKAQDSL